MLLPVNCRSCQHDTVKLLSAICLLLLLPLACASSDLTPVPEDAVPVEGTEGTYRFGAVYEGETVIAVFKIINESNSYLTIDQVESNCGCTTAKLDGKQIPARGYLLVTVKLNTNRLWGPQSKTVTLHTNAPWRPRIKLLMEGVVRQKLGLEPRRIRTATPDENYQTRVRVTNITADPLLVTGLTTNPEGLLQASFEQVQAPHTLAAGESLIIAVNGRLKHPGANLVGSVFIHLEGNEHPIRLPVYLERTE